MHAGQAQLNAVDGLGRGEHIHVAGSDLAAGDLLDERAGNVGDVHAAGLVDLALKANGASEISDRSRLVCEVRPALKQALSTITSTVSSRSRNPCRP